MGAGGFWKLGGTLLGHGWDLNRTWWDIIRPSVALNQVQWELVSNWDLASMSVQKKFHRGQKKNQLAQPAAGEKC